MRLLINPRFKLVDDKIIRGETMLSFNNKHVLINVQKFQLEWLEGVKENHHVHIFVNWFMDPFYGCDNFFEFCEAAARKTKHDVIIHAWSKDYKGIKYSIESKLDGFHEYKIAIDKKPVTFAFYKKCGISFGMVIANQKINTRDPGVKDIAFVSAYSDLFPKTFYPKLEENYHDC